MSERGSFVTEYIYCDKCFEAMKKVLVCDDKYLRGVVIPMWTGGGCPELPIIAGKVGGLYSGEEKAVFDLELRNQIEDTICHPVDVAVLCGNGFRMILNFRPAGEN